MEPLLIEADQRRRRRREADKQRATKAGERRADATGGQGFVQKQAELLPALTRWPVIDSRVARKHYLPRTAANPDKDLAICQCRSPQSGCD
ncbi:hypothetical protein EYF80_026229 [Liparis tanakae]|uniref:Uncharacterized protein n=1 Tax=Liparis tanakae TaxID=230148 RepID=A0A4Z2HCG2_9TELE|nr:hypothetical protein EYF80_026229 [Liparis tanakae]